MNFYVTSEAMRPTYRIAFDSLQGVLTEVTEFSEEQRQSAYDYCKVLNEIPNGDQTLLRNHLVSCKCSEEVIEAARQVMWKDDHWDREQTGNCLPMTIGGMISALLELCQREDGAVDLTSPILIGLPDENFTTAECSVTALRVAWVKPQPGGAAVVVEPIQSEDGNGGYDSGWRFEEGVYRRQKPKGYADELSDAYGGSTVKVEG